MVLGQVVRQVDGVGVADEGGVPFIAEDGEGARWANQPESVLVELEVLDHLLAEDEQRPGPDTVLEAFEELLRRGLPTGPVRLLEHEDPMTGSLELDPGGEAVVAGPHDDHVMFGHGLLPFASAGTRTEVRGRGIESE